jgi:hypothetical protein
VCLTYFVERVLNMPVKCVKRGNKYRIVGSNGGIKTTTKGTPVDGGGHASASNCTRQARAINANIENTVAHLPRFGEEVWNWPEFQRLMDKLGVRLPERVGSVILEVRAEQLVRVTLGAEGFE